MVLPLDHVPGLVLGIFLAGGASGQSAGGAAPAPTPTPTPKPVSQGGMPAHSADPGQQAIINEITAVFGSYAQGALNVARCESGYDPNAWNPYAIGNSHASGVFQILYPSTWNGTSYAASSPFNAAGVSWLRTLNRGCNQCPLRAGLRSLVSTVP